jgi:hypothetical protein
MQTTGLRRTLVVAAGIVALIFGLATLAQGGMTLFGDDATRAAAGNIVPFVLWFNFLAGFAYVAAGIGLALDKRWAVGLAALIAAATAAVFVAFGIYVWLGRAYEIRTVAAMTLRTVFWLGVWALGSWVLRQRESTTQA